VIGGFDPCAAAGLRAYAEEARRRGYDPAYCDSIVELAGDFEKLSATPRAVSIADPDAPPHRRDLPEVIAMMRRKYDVRDLVARLNDVAGSSKSMTLGIKVGQIWQEVDPRFVGPHKTVAGFDPDGKVQLSVQVGVGKVRITKAKPERFNGKRGGYQLIKDVS